MEHSMLAAPMVEHDGDLTSRLVRENAELRRQLASLRAFGGETQRELFEENGRLKRELAGLSALSHLAFNDPLTGLRNRRYFDDRLRQELSRVRREVNGTLSLMLLDVDDLKVINDQHGHVRGDEVLRWVAQFVTRNLRDHDVCCRLGGDEFAAILPHATADGCDRLMARVKSQLTLANRERDLPVSLSVGTATSPDLPTDASALYSAADARMYEDKRRAKQARAIRVA